MHVFQQECKFRNKSLYARGNMCRPVGYLIIRGWQWGFRRAALSAIFGLSCIVKAEFCLSCIVQGIWPWSVKVKIMLVVHRARTLSSCTVQRFRKEKTQKVQGPPTYTETKFLQNSWNYSYWFAFSWLVYRRQYSGDSPVIQIQIQIQNTLLSQTEKLQHVMLRAIK